MMNSKEQEEFYVGYLPKAPGGIGGIVRRAVVVLGIVTVVVVVALVTGQHRFAASFFEFGNVREFEGVAREWPNPMLVAQAGTYALVAEGKHGAEAMVARLDGKAVKLRGTLIHRDATEMIEVVAGSVQAAPQNVAPPTSSQALGSEDLGWQTLAGEIVDSKCYLGVMNPGHTKPHRECASLCIRGGIPPLFVIKDADGRDVHLWLVSEKGEPVNQQVLEFVAEPIEITGQIKRQGDQLYFYANPQAFHRL
ncbi:MAG: hypothetical protein ABI977_05620 [Acidobacteriota bacterium]